MKQLIKNDGDFHKLKKILLKNIDAFDIINIISNYDFRSSFHTYKLENMINFKDIIESEILTTYNLNYVDNEFMNDMDNLYKYFYKLTTYLCKNTQSKNGLVNNGVKTEKEFRYIRDLRLKIVNILTKYI